MNLHMPQDPESEAELKNLAAVPYQIVSPANNASIIGIYQDSMLGSYQFTREGIRLNPREAMNLLMMFNGVNEIALLDELKKEGGITNFDIISQIMPPLSMKYKTKEFKDDKDDVKTSNAVVEIKNGKYIRGQMDKSVMGARTKGLLQRVCNDFGNMASAKFIDDLQNVITEYMKSSAFSVGISDLISNQKTNDEIIQVITKKKTDVKNLIDQVQIGVFENNTGKTNEEEFETQVNSILNQATSESGKIGLKSLGKNNRFVIMVKAGSKGSDLNISQMISCLGQQNVDGKRIPYGFENRTLPHFTKYDDSPGARGFVESSYINGLTPQELFFHAMGGRVGLIDTAVKTSTTGYIQRRLIKGLEDLMVSYDMTIRTNKNKIVQFQYGDDGIDTTKVEDQSIPIVGMSTQDIYAHYLVPEESGKIKTLNNIFLKNVMARNKKQQPEFMTKTQQYIDWMIKMREDIIKHVFKNKSDSTINSPVAFAYIINNVQGQCNITISSLVDITLLEALEMIEKCYSNLGKIFYAQPTELFKTLFYYYLSPKELLIVKRFNKAALTLLLDTVTVNYKRAIVAPGEMVGMIAAQSIGEVSTQMTLNTFHFAGVASKSNVTRGVPRIEEILRLTKNPKHPSLTVHMNEIDEQEKDRASQFANMLEHTRLVDVVKSVQICFDPSDKSTNILEDKVLVEQYYEFENMVKECMEDESATATQSKSKWIIRIEMNMETMLEKNITMDDVHFAINSSHGDDISCVYADYNANNLIFRIRLNEKIMNKGKKVRGVPNALDQSDDIYMLRNFQENLLNNIVLRGINGITNVLPRKLQNYVIKEDGKYVRKDIWIMDTTGSNLMEMLAIDFIDANRTFCNDIHETYNVLGIEAARQVLYNELVEVMEFADVYINYHHLSLLCDRMTSTENMVAIFRSGILNDDIGPIAKSTFEVHTEVLLNASRHADFDHMRGVSANVMMGQMGVFGTGSFQVVLDMDQMKNMEDVEVSTKNDRQDIEKMFGAIADPTDACSLNKLVIRNNLETLNSHNTNTCDDDGYDAGF